ncbi:MAG: hypothetical protein ACLFSE_08760 [Spirochaetia bacterium]
MNQDQVKEKLLLLKDDIEEFTVIFSGKESKRTNGLYHPDTREIIIHNRNFNEDGPLMYTAVHEFAHHVHFTTSPVPISAKAHTIEFRSIFHDLLKKAEEVGIYSNIFESNQEFRTLTQEIQEKFLTGNGELMKEFGGTLIRAAELCRKYDARFEDYIERTLKLDIGTARTLMKVKNMNFSPALGFENMKTLSSIRNEEKRKEAENALRSGKTPSEIKYQLKNKETDPASQLSSEKKRIERTIKSLSARLEVIEKKLADLDHIA